MLTHYKGKMYCEIDRFRMHYFDDKNYYKCNEQKKHNHRYEVIVQNENLANDSQNIKTLTFRSKKIIINKTNKVKYNKKKLTFKFKFLGY